MHLFHWLPAITLTANFDLRRRGWQLVDNISAAASQNFYPALTVANSFDDCYLQNAVRISKIPFRQILVLNVTKAAERARMIQSGFGDALADNATLAEIEARALRIQDQCSTIPRIRTIDKVTLNLLFRDGYVNEKPLGLHPREFELLWKLAERPGVSVSKQELMHDIWHMSFIPNTNTLAVHIFRLRAKLALAGVHGLIRTTAAKDYVLSITETQPLRSHTKQPSYSAYSHS